MTPVDVAALLWWGPALVVAGAGSLLLGAAVHGGFARPTILPTSSGDEGAAPEFWERVSVHLLVYGFWGVGFGAVIWRGPPDGMIDVRLPFERHWPVWEAAEWIYASVYVVPVAVPWLARTRRALRRYAWSVVWLVGVSVPMFVLLPLGSPPREFEPVTLVGRLLAWETSRPDFAAASLPSFHVFWGLLVAQLLPDRGRWWGWAGRAWAIAVTLACLATGAHAIVDVVASWLLFPVFTGARSPVARALQAWVDRRLTRNIAPTPSTAPTSSPPAP